MKKVAWIIGFFTVWVCGQVHEEMTLILRQLRVHVTTKKGVAVTGLQQSDFQVFEDGLLQDISFFEEVDVRAPEGEASWDEQPAQSKARRQAVVLFFDTNMLERSAMPKLLDAASTWIETGLREGDLLKIVNMKHKLVHVTPFSTDLSAAKEGLQGVAYDGTLRKELQRYERELLQVFAEFETVEHARMGPEGAPTPESLKRERIEPIVTQILREKDMAKRFHSRQFDESLAAIVELLMPMDGEKSVYLISGGSFGNSDVKEISGLGVDREIIAAMNSANIKLYGMVHRTRQPVGKSFRGFRSRPNRRRQADIGLGRRTVFEEADKMEEGPRQYTEDTGGFLRTVVDNESMIEAVNELNSLASHYYVLGYTIERKESHAKVKVQFKEKKRGKKLFYGSRFSSWSPAVRDEAEPVSQVIASEAELFYGSALRNDLDCTCDHHLFENDAGGFSVPISLQLTAKPFPKKGYEVSFGLMTKKHEIVDETLSTVMEADVGPEISFYDVLMTKKQPRFIRYSVKDLDRDLTCLGELEILEEPVMSQEPHLSQVVFGAVDGEVDVLPLHMLRQESESDVARIQEDPYLLADYLFVPKIKDSFVEPEFLELFFHLVNAEPLTEEVQLRVLARTREKAVALPGGVDQLLQVGPNLQYCLVGVQTDGLAPDVYVFTVEFTYPDSQQQLVRHALARIAPKGLAFGDVGEDNEKLSETEEDDPEQE